MKFIQLYLILIVFTLSVLSSALSPLERQESLISCLKLKKQAPYLNLNCGNLLESPLEENGNDFKVENGSQIYQLSLDELKANTRKIEKKEEEKLFAMLKLLKKNEHQSIWINRECRLIVKNKISIYRRCFFVWTWYTRDRYIEWAIK